MNSLRFMRPARIVFLGPPGAGKGTYGLRLAKSWNIPHVATGDMLREEIQSGSELGRQIDSYTKAGKLVPDELVNNIAKWVRD